VFKAHRWLYHSTLGSPASDARGRSLVVEVVRRPPHPPPAPAPRAAPHERFLNKKR